MSNSSTDDAAGHGSSARKLELEHWRCFQTQLLQCWLGKAIAHTAESAIATAAVESVALLALREEDDAAFDRISAFARHFHTLRQARRANAVQTTSQIHCAALKSVVLTHSGDGACATDVGAFDTWLQSYHAQLVSCDQRSCLVVLFAPRVLAATLHEITQAVARSSTAYELHTLLLVITDPIALMDVDASLSARSSSPPHCQGFQLFDSHTISDSISDARYLHASLMRPLQQLSSQCGLRFVLEIARWTLFQSTAPASNPRPKHLPRMLASTAHMPFQLLLQLLRWSHFHPTLTQALAKPLVRKLQLIPQRRIRDAVLQLSQEEQATWRLVDGVASSSSTGSPCGTDDGDSLTVMAQTQRRRLASSEQEFASAAIEIPVQGFGSVDCDRAMQCPLSKCQLWDVQKQFYLAQGIRAWSDGIIPFGVSSSSFLAAAYARVAIEFFVEANCRDSTHATGSSTTPNCFVWEAASGSCKFLHAFLVHFFDLVDELQLTHRGLRPCVVASDLSDQVLASRRAMACFAPFLASGRLEFARFDTADFTSGDAARTLQLQHSNTLWRVGLNGPVFLMGNYFLDSLRTDVFAVTIAASEAQSGDSGDYKAEVDLTQTTPSLQHTQSPMARARLKVHRGRVDHRVTSIADMELSFERVDPFETSTYDDPFVHQILLDVLDSVANAHVSSSAASSSLILFPVEVIQFLRALTAPTVDTNGSQRLFPVGFLVGDASFSCRDPISSAFFTREHDSDVLELPQLSPHPDCFCLPVDFEILRLVVQRLGLHYQASTHTQVASAIATDTFDVLFGTISARGGDCELAQTLLREPAVNSSRASHTAFAHEFASFTPSDCDLLWGMMGVDDGAVHFSLKSQLALLAQSAWDFDLFVILQWQLLRCWRQVTRQQTTSTTSTTERASSDALRQQLIGIAKRCWRTQYSLEREDTAQSLTLLQHCRWLYGLGAHTDVASLLTEKLTSDAELETNTSICYLLGLALFHTGDRWLALACFRKCVAAAPTRIKYQRRVAQTLLALQHEKLVEQTS